MKKVMSKYVDGGRIKRRSTTVKVVKDTPNKISAISTTTVNRKSGTPKKVVSKSYENTFDAKGQVVGGSDVLKIEKSKYDKSGKLKSTATRGTSSFQKGGSTTSPSKIKGQALKMWGDEKAMKGAMLKDRAEKSKSQSLGINKQDTLFGDHAMMKMINEKYSAEAIKGKSGAQLKAEGLAKKKLGDKQKAVGQNLKKIGDARKAAGNKMKPTRYLKDGGGIISKLKSKGQAIRKAGQNLKNAVTKRMQNGGVSGSTNTNTTLAQRLNMPAPTGAVDRMNTNTTQGQRLNMSRSASPADTMNTNTTKGPRLGSGPTPGYKKGGSKMKIGAPKPGSAKPGSRRSKGY